MTSSSAQVVVAVKSDQTVAVAFSDRRGAAGELLQPRMASEASSLLSAPSFLIVTFELSGLGPDTVYHYDVLLGNGAAPVVQGRLKTFPPEGTPASFRIVASGDAKTGSNHGVFDAIRSENPLLFLHLGDLHYEDIKDDDGIKYIRANERVLNQSRQAALYRNVPIAYTWDDHDYSHNNATSEAIGRIVARQMYVACVPHYPIAEQGFDRAIYQAFTIGRVRFLLSDCRSERTKQTMLGTAQKQWLKDELLRSRDEHPLVVWINTVPWIAKPGEKSWDRWHAERAEIANFIELEKIRNLCMLSADAHMLAIDDGSNNQPPIGGGGFPVFQASPLDRSGSVKGGPYSHKPVTANGGQYGVMRVTDTGGDTVSVRWEGKRTGSGVLMSHEFVSPSA